MHRGHEVHSLNHHHQVDRIEVPLAGETAGQIGAGIDGRQELAAQWEPVPDADLLTEAEELHELFWYARILIDYYDNENKHVAENLMTIAQAKNASTAVRCAVLETEALKHGLGEYREKVLDEASLGLVTYAAMYGLRKKEKASRNQKFKYIGRAGAQWRLITKIASNF